jgi:hypothetical protein
VKKKVLGDNAYFTVEWSDLIKYDKHHASRVLPELAGILYFIRSDHSTVKYALSPNTFYC